MQPPRTNCQCGSVSGFNRLSVEAAMRKYMSKRQRPCDFCRSRKVACQIDVSPPCRACISHGRQCNFVESPPVRKKPMSQDRSDGTIASEDPANATLNNLDDTPVPSATETMAPETGVVAQANWSLPNDPSEFLQDLDMDGSQYEFIFETPRGPPLQQILPYDALPALQPLSPPSTTGSSPAILDGNRQGDPQILGLTGDQDPYLLRQYHADNGGVSRFKKLAIQSVCDTPVPVQFILSRPSFFHRAREEAGHLPIDGMLLKAELEKVVSNDIGARLISVYRRFIMPLYPIFSSQLPPSPDSSPPGLLAAIYSIAFPFAKYDGNLSIELAYDELPYSHLSQIINKSLAADLHSPTLAVVQTLLLMTVRISSNPMVSDASYRWTLLCTLVSSAVNLGLHLDPASWQIPEWQRALRRRLSFSIYATDRWLTASLGRPLIIDDQNWLVTSLELSDSYDIDGEPNFWAQYLQLASQTACLNSTLSYLYTLRAAARLASDAGETTRLVTGLLSGLSSGTHDYDETDPGSFRMLHTISRLGHIYNKLLILRAWVQACAPESDTEGSLTVEHLQTRHCARSTMRGCTRDFTSFIKNLSIDDINGFWPPWCPTAFSSLCFTLLLMIVSSRSLEEALEWVADLHAAREELRLKARSLHALRLALLRVDSIFWRGVRNVLRLAPHVEEAFRISPQT